MPLPYSPCTDSVILQYYYKARLTAKKVALTDEQTQALAQKLANKAEARGGARGLILPYLELCITPRCTLRCKHCANFMQNYIKAKDYSLQEIMEPLITFLDAVDYIAKFRILGGEPLLHKDLPTILDFCGNHPKIGRLVVVTNGSLMPDKKTTDALKSSGAQVDISNYPSTEEGRKHLQRNLKQMGVHTLFPEHQEWIAYGNGERFDYTPEEVQEVFNSCPMPCKTLVRNEFHICPRSAHGTALGLVPKREQDFLDVSKASKTTIRQRVVDLFNTEYLEACYYCRKKSLAPRVPAGEQMTGSTAGKKSISQYNDSKNIRVDEYMEKVEGWLDPNYLNLIEDIGIFQLDNNIHGSVLEIGVYHGKFFIPLHNTLKKDERSFAVDLFNEQQWNTDFSGYGDDHLASFQTNLRAYATRPEACTIIQADQLTWKAEELNGNPCRLISIDGGHTEAHTWNALQQCEGLLANGGLIFVDDYTNMHWPGVHIGLVNYYLHRAPAIAPVFFGWNKLVLCGVSRHPFWLSYFARQFQAKQSCKLVTMFGYQTYTIA